MVKLLVGIFAYNEEREIEQTIRTVLEQTVFHAMQHTYDTKLIVIANGCTDATATVSHDTLALLESQYSQEWQVIEIDQPGKANAWNHFVHCIAPADATHLAMMDADVRFESPSSIERSVDALEADPNVWIATPKLVKSFPKGKTKLVGRLMVRMFAGTADATDNTIAGAFYCGRADQLRQVVMPIGVIVEDGFLRAMILTSGLTEQEKPARVSQVASVTVHHIPYTKITEILRYQVRQAKGTAINWLVFKDFEELPKTFSARMRAVSSRNKKRPEWVQDLITLSILNQSALIPFGYTYRRLNRIRRGPVLQRIKGILLLPALILDVWIAHKADAELRNPLMRTHWDAIRNLDG